MEMEGGVVREYQTVCGGVKLHVSDRVIEGCLL